MNWPWHQAAGGVIWALILAAGTVTSADTKAPPALPAAFRWELSAPFIEPADRQQDRSIAQKDPSVVFHEGTWHLFMTIKCQGYTIMEHTSFTRWEDANTAPRHIIRMHEQYACAPQVFYFRPHKKWYMVYQRGGYPTRGLKMQVVFSTTQTIENPASWSPPQLFFPDKDPQGVAGWLDFWTICDQQHAYLFFTSLNGRMWRMRTALSDFPHGFVKCELALQADIFEASHTYKLKGTDRYLTLIEAQGRGGRRYYKAYLADRLDGPWSPLADTEAKPFAGSANVRPAQDIPLWADNISHGELVRDSNDETLTVDPANLRFVIQGVLDREKAGIGYGQIPWRIGLLRQISPETP